MEEITYLTDPVKAYQDAIDKCESYTDLQKVLADFSMICEDAIKAAPKNDEEYKEFVAGLKKERRGRFAGEAFTERYGPVLMPEVMFRVSLIADKYKAPWGLAFIRLREQGAITVNGGIAKFSKWGYV